MRPPTRAPDCTRDVVVGGAGVGCGKDCLRGLLQVGLFDDGGIVNEVGGKFQGLDRFSVRAFACNRATDGGGGVTAKAALA